MMIELTRKLSIEKFLEGIDNQIEDIERQKKWYLDYRAGSGMTEMLEQFAEMIDNHIAKFKLMKRMARSIDPKSLLELGVD